MRDSTWSGSRTGRTVWGGRRGRGDRVKAGYVVSDGFGDEVAPVAVFGYAEANLSGGDGVENGVEREVEDAVLEVKRGLVAALAVGDEQREFPELFLDGRFAGVVPVNDALGGITSAEEKEGGAGIDFASFAGDFEEEAAFSYGDGEVRLSGGGAADEFDALFEGDLFVVFVREAAGHDEDDLVDHLKRSAGEREVGAGDGMEAAGKDADTERGSGRSQ